ncbi:MAG TPA: amidase [Candidatus Dormibacteraeota bacterium]|nr:amidase [Candidatus Dormibacteraeota bacterium]
MGGAAPGTASRPLPLCPAHVQLRALATGEIGAEELLGLHLERIARYNPALNAIVTPNVEAARQAARRADTARARGTVLGPLQGLPVTIKDAIDVAGLPTTAGLPARARALAERDSPLAAAVRQAGAVLLGKTNVPTRTADWQTENPLFGRTVNPWDPSRTPGGSTGGGAAALAAGLSALEFGSDIGGSIRVPAAFCGVYGHRPSETLVPRHGHVPGTPRPNPAVVMGVLGPLARDARDLALALDVIAGPVAGEAIAWRLDLPPTRHHRLRDFRVALVPEVDWLPVDAEVRAAQERVADALRRAGARVAPALPEGFDLRRHEELYSQLLGVMVFADLADARRAEVATAAGRTPTPVGTPRAAGILASARHLIELHHRRELQRAQWRAFFTDWDVLLSPSPITPAFPHIDVAIPFSARTLTLDGGAGPTIPYAYLEVLPGLAALSGQPATEFPAGRTAAGLPIGLEAIGPYLEDRTPITLAALLADELGGFAPPPGFG